MSVGKVFFLFSLILIFVLLIRGQESLCTDTEPFSLPSNAYDCDVGRLSSLRRNNAAQTLILFPDVKLDCDGTLVALSVVGWQHMSKNARNIKIQFFRRSEMSSTFHRVDPGIVLSQSLQCEDTLCLTTDTSMSSATSANSSATSRPTKCLDCKIPEEMQVQVQHGDILGFILPRKQITIDPCFAEISHDSTKLCVCSFNGLLQNLKLRPEGSVHCTFNNYWPQIRFSVHKDKESNLQPEYIVGPVFAVLLIIIGVLVVAGIYLFYRQRKYSRALSLAVSTPGNNVYPNPMYHMNADLKGESEDTAVDQCTSLSNVDYDEISDEHRSEKASEKSESKVDKSMSQALGNNYFVLTQDQEQCPERKNSGKFEQAQTIAANYEVYIPTNDRNVESGDERPKETSDLDDTYWEPADSINELYKQLSSNKYREIPPHQVNLLGVLGSGEFGTVNKGSWESPLGAMGVAVKQLQPGASDEEKVKFLQEAAINGQFRHPNVVKLMGVVTTGETTMIVLELLSNGDLRSFLNKLQRSEIPNACGDQQGLLKFCQQVASGMEYLSNKDYVHRDLAARNILVSGDHVCKISDFGMSRNLMDEDYYVSHGGRIPVKWTAPEAIHYKKHSSASDVWSFGCVMYEIWSLGHKPFESHTNPDVIRMVDKGYRLPPPPGLSKELYKIMMQCWKPKSSHRPTFTQLVEMLSRADFELFVWKEEDLRDTDPRVKDIGAPLEVAEKLYLDIQNMYK